VGNLIPSILFCIPLSHTLSQVKIKMQCVPLAGRAPCTECFCRPMWCQACLVKVVLPSRWAFSDVFSGSLVGRPKLSRRGGWEERLTAPRAVLCSVRSMSRASSRQAGRDAA
jgi:hypothetical protein